MNKLRKPIQNRPSLEHSAASRGWAAASTAFEVGTPNIIDRCLDNRNVGQITELMTAAEQYWATRALKAEALLAAKEAHYKELRSMAYSQEMKRNRELSQLAQQHKEKQVVIEKVATILAVCLLSLVSLVIYQATRHHNHNNSQRRGLLASHFTIPILSPFTSVVEQETSVIGAKSIGTMVIVAGCLAYFAFRHYVSRPTNQRLKY